MTTTTTTKFSFQLIPVALVFTVIFFILKITNVLPFDWFWVFSPLLFAVALLIAVLLFAAAVFGFIGLLALVVVIKSK